MNVQVVERVQRQLVVDLADMTEEQQQSLTEGIEDLLRRVLDPHEEEVVAGWTATALREALLRLVRIDAHVQAEAIRTALKNGGYVTRDRVFRIGRYDKDRSLRGFTRPVNRVVADFKARGLVAADAVDLLVTSYQDGVKADGFQVDSRLADLLP